jgi:adenylylsulfate kinase-like enzyme
MTSAPVYVITGQVSAGKSTLAKALLARHPFGVHVDVDELREMVVSGLAGPLEWTAETSRQFDLALRSAAAIAAVYHAAGFAVAIEGSVDPVAASEHVADAGLAQSTVGVVLLPQVEVALARNAERTTKGFDTAVLDEVIRRLDGEIRTDPLPQGWLRLDNGTEDVEATVERVLTHPRASTRGT